MNNNDKRRQYWNERFDRESYVWGKKPSKSAVLARKLFSEQNVQKILIPGVGYGRNAKIFTDNGFTVTGIEISDNACRLAEDFDPKTKIIKGDILSLGDRGFPSLRQGSFDAIYCFNVLHLFKKEDRKKFLQQCSQLLGKSGYLFFVVFSEQESSFGCGQQVEKNTFISKPGRPVHYFTHRDLREHFNDLAIIKTGIVKDREDHGPGSHVHKLRYVFACKERS